MTTLTDPEVVKALNDLRHLDHDAIQSYEHALKHVDDDLSVKADLLSFKLDHERHIVELDIAVAAHGGVPEELHRDVKGLLLEGLTALRSVTGMLGALKAMRTNEKHTNAKYDAAMELALPRDVLLVILSALDDERRHLAAIEAHIERLEDDALEDEADRADYHPGVRM
jgi:rubrerythrin